MRFNTEFIEWDEQKCIMPASGEYNIVLLNMFNKFSTEPAQS